MTETTRQAGGLAGVDKWSSLDYGRTAHWWDGNEGTACGRDFHIDIRHAYAEDKRCEKCLRVLEGRA